MSRGARQSAYASPSRSPFRARRLPSILQSALLRVLLLLIVRVLEASAASAEACRLLSPGFSGACVEARRAGARLKRFVLLPLSLACKRPSAVLRSSGNPSVFLWLFFCKPCAFESSLVSINRPPPRVRAQRAEAALLCFDSLAPRPARVLLCPTSSAASSSSMDHTPARAQARALSPSYSRPATQHDERFSESQESYVTSNSNATHPSLPGLVPSGGSVSQLSTSGSPSFELDRSASPPPASAMRHSFMTADSHVADKASLRLSPSHPPSTPPEYLAGKTSNAWSGDDDDDSSPSSGGSNSPPTRGIKRSANGTAKLQSPVAIITPSSLEDPHQHHIQAGTPRQQYVREVPTFPLVASCTLPTDKAFQQATKLQMRLQLAMTKVKHGWENMSMDEIDEMHSTLTSPTSASARTPTFAAFPYPSPRQIAHPQRHSRNLSSITNTTATSIATSRPTTSYYSRQSPPSHHHARSHSTLSEHARYTSTRNHPSLAPALDLATAKDARYGPMHNRMTTPTPQEQDALDSLMLMGSPAGHFVRR